MKLKSLSLYQQLTLVLSSVIFIASLLFFSKVYFTNKEVSLLFEQCLENDGSPDLYISTLHVDYSFACKIF